MTRKHFIEIARAFEQTKPPEVDEGGYANQLYQWGKDVRAQAAVCAQFNDNFDQGRFLKACGMEQ